MVQHEGMDTSSAPSKREALACAAASVLLGAYMASTVQNVALQIVMLSCPPAALLAALRPGRQTTNHAPAAVEPVASPATFEEVTVALELDILSRAS